MGGVSGASSDVVEKRALLRFVFREQNGVVCDPSENCAIIMGIEGFKAFRRDAECKNAAIPPLGFCEETSEKVRTSRFLFVTRFRLIGVD